MRTVYTSKYRNKRSSHQKKGEEKVARKKEKKKRKSDDDEAEEEEEEEEEESKTRHNYRFAELIYWADFKASPHLSTSTDLTPKEYVHTRTYSI